MHINYIKWDVFSDFIKCISVINFISTIIVCKMPRLNCELTNEKVQYSSNSFCIGKFDPFA